MKTQTRELLKWIIGFLILVLIYLGLAFLTPQPYDPNYNYNPFFP